MLQAAAAYQTPKARLATPSAGARLAAGRATVGVVSVGAEARRHDRHRDRREDREDQQRGDRDRWSGIAASRRTPTPALPPMPCTSPIPNAPSGVRTP